MVSRYVLRRPVELETTTGNARWMVPRVLVLEGAVISRPGGRGTARGRHEIKAFFSAIFQAMPDVRFTIEDNFGTADRGLCRGTISATLRGDFGPLPATGKSATAPIAEIFRIADGQIVEVWVYPDTLSIMQQFGIIPTSGGA